MESNEPESGANLSFRPTTEVLTATPAPKAPSPIRRLSRILFEEKTDEIDTFVASIGETVIIKDEYDQEIVNQLIDYMKIYQKDIKDSKKIIDDVEIQYNELETQYYELKDTLATLSSINKVAESVQQRLSRPSVVMSTITETDIAKDIELSSLEQMKKHVSDVLQNDQQMSQELGETIHNRELVYILLIYIHI